MYAIRSYYETNIAYATIEALQSLEPSKNWVTTKAAATKKPEKKATAKTTKKEEK